MLHFDPNITTEQSSTITFAQTPKEELVDTIKNDLFVRGYTYEHFLALDNQMQEGSRQLLVCVGWLIYHLKLIEQCMEQCLKSNSILDNDDTSSLYHAIDGEQIQYQPEKDLIGQVKQAMRANAKLRFGLRRLHALVTENTNLQHQIHTSHQMSSFEAHLCQHPDLLSHYIIDLEVEQRKLNLFLFWNEHENIFWKWMESVLDQTSVTSIENENYESINQIDYQRLEAEKQRFNAALDTLDSALVRLEQLWISNNHHTDMEHDISSIITSIDTQISSLFSQLLASSPSIPLSHSDRSLFLNQPYSLVFSKKDDSIDDDNNRFIKPIDFDHETKRLNTLQSNIDQKIEKHRATLDTLSHQFKHTMIV